MSIKGIIDSEIKDLNLNLIIEGLNEIINDKPSSRGSDDKIPAGLNSNFYLWFGASKVVNKYGKPLVMHHGGSFSPTKQQQGQGQGQRGQQGNDDGNNAFRGTAWFTAYKSDAQRYAKNSGGNLTSVYIRILKPLYAGWQKDGSFIETNAAIRHAIKSQGKYDGVIDVENGGILDAVVWESNQIKSVDNNGEYNLSEPDVLKEIINNDDNNGNFNIIDTSANVQGVSAGNFTTALSENDNDNDNNVQGLDENVYKVYHGTNHVFSKFNFANATQGIIWFTDSLESIQKGEHGGVGNQIVMTRYITINKPAGWTEYERYGLGQLRQLGYDGVILPQGEKTDYFVFSPKSISAKDNSSSKDNNSNSSNSPNAKDNNLQGLSEDGDVVVDIVNDELNADNCVLEENEYIEEGYREADELNLLAIDIINYFGHANWSILKRINEEGKITERNFNFPYHDAELQEIILSSNYTKYSNNIKKFSTTGGVSIYFMTIASSDSGLYFNNTKTSDNTSEKDNKIYINLNDENYINRVKSYAIDADEHTSAEYEKILVYLLNYSLKRTIIHELQHAYDDFISNGKYATDKRSKNYYANANNKHNSFDPKSKISDEQYKIYYNLPHEYWARFSEALANMDVRPDLDDFNATLNDFKRGFDGYETLLPNAKKRILNSLYKYYDLKKDNLNVNKVINEELNLLSEGLSEILYHFTYVTSLLSMLKANKFATSSNLGSNADQWKDKGRFFFFSTQRTKGMSGYGSHHGNVAIVLDGRKLNYSFKGQASDYWSWSTKMSDYKSLRDYTQALRSEENEDRIVTNKPYIDNANKYIIEIHVEINENQDKEQVIEVQKLCKGLNIPLFFYNDDQQFKLQNKAKAVPLESIELQPKVKSGYDEKEDERDLYNAKWFFKKIAPSIIAGNADNTERLQIEKLLKDLLEQGDQIDQFDNVMQDINEKAKRLSTSSWGRFYADDELLSMQAEIHNHRGDPNSYLRQLLQMLIADMRKWQVKNLKEYFNKKFRAGIKENMREDTDSSILNETQGGFTRVFHGTSVKDAENIIKYGVNISKSTGGYFGWGFYTATEFQLAKSNYADFAEEQGSTDKGVVLEFRVSPQANILDLRKDEDFKIWQPYSKAINQPNLYQVLVKHGIDGLYDNSFEGVVIYNAKVLTLVKTHSL